MSVSSVPVESAGAIQAGGAAGTRRQELLRELARSKLFWVGAAILLFWIVCAIFGPLIAPYGPIRPEPARRSTRRPPAAHLFGTDALGRDMLSRVIVGSRDILIVAPLATLLGTVVGTALGLVMGYFRGFVDDVLSRFVEAFLALPLVVTAVLVVVALGHSNVTLILVIGAVFTPLIARTVRAAVLQERELDYVAAARLRGERAPYVMFVEILPNVLPPILVEFTVRLGYAIFTVAALSFLGFGIQLPSPDWGLEISQNYGQVTAGLLVGGPVRRAGHRLSDRGRELRLRRGRGGVGGMTAPAGVPSSDEGEPAFPDAADGRSSRGGLPGPGARSEGAARPLVPHSARRVLRARGRVGVGQVDRGPFGREIPGPQRARERRPDHRRRAGRAQSRSRRPAPAASGHGVNGLPGARESPQSDDPCRPPGGGGV